MIDEVVMLRHGRTSYNHAHRLQGQIDVPLDLVGQWQADQSGLELAKRYYWAKVSDVAAHPARLAQPGPQAAERSDIEEYHASHAATRRMIVVSSDLFRAVQTAHAFADPLGLEVSTDRRLRERSFGQWEGLTREQIRRLDPQAYDSWKRKQGGEAAYGVESREAVGRRGADAVLALIDRYRDDSTATTLMLVGHGSWIAATIETLIGLRIGSLSGLGVIGNAFWSRLSVIDHVDDQRLDVPAFRLDAFNEAPALARDMDWDNGPDWLHPSRPATETH